MLEGARNVGRHAHARSAAITADANGAKVHITITDDGVGFPAGSAPPWSISSRAAEVGGEVRLGDAEQAGAHLEIHPPRVRFPRPPFPKPPPRAPGPQPPGARPQARFVS